MGFAWQECNGKIEKYCKQVWLTSGVLPFQFSSHPFKCFLFAILIACILACYLQPLFVNNNSFLVPGSFYPCFSLAITFLHTAPVLLLFHSLFTGIPLLFTQPLSLPQCLDATRRSRGGAASAFSIIRACDCQETEHTMHMQSMCLLNRFKLKIHNNIPAFCFVCGCFKLVESQYRNKLLTISCQVSNLGS